MIIRPETFRDHTNIWRVNAEAFGQCKEADLVDALRDEAMIVLSLVAEIEKQLVGHILFSRVVIQTPDRVARGVALAPIAVLPSHQRQGIGSALVREGMKVLREQGEKIVIVLGPADFYPRFGFTTTLAESLTAPFSGDAWMAAELVPDALNGIVGKVNYPPPFKLGE